MTDKEIFAVAKKVLNENTIKGQLDDGTAFHYTKPSPGRYPYQFFWDTCFHMYIFSALGETNMARKHLRSLFAKQRKDGFVGHMIYWDRLMPGRLTDFFQSQPRIKNLYRPHMSSLIQPPIVAQALARIYRTSGDKDFLWDMLPKLKMYYHWLAQNRDFEDEGLLTIISPFESGMDWKPTYDVALGLPERKANWLLALKVYSVDFRNFLHDFNLDEIYRKGYFLVKDTGLNTIYAQNLHILAALCREIGDPEAELFQKRGDLVTRSMLKIMYDEEDAAFYDVYGRQNRKIRILTPTIFYPVVIKGLPEEVATKVIKTHFFNEKEFGVEFPLPSVAKNHPSFNPTESTYIWRGPTWIVHNWFMHQFLWESGYRDESKKLVESIRRLIDQSGFREYYNPFTGQGYGAKDFTWAALVVDMINMENGVSLKKDG